MKRERKRNKRRQLSRMMKKEERRTYRMQRRRNRLLGRKRNEMGEKRIEEEVNVWEGAGGRRGNGRGKHKARTSGSY